MKNIWLFLFVTLLVCCGMSNVALAAIDSSAPIVKLRLSCTENNISLDNCFSSVSDFTTWLANIRRPNSTTPLKVEIGPGTFTQPISITCDPNINNTGYIYFEGAGNGQTILKSLTYSTPLSVKSCTEMSFSHFAIIGTKYAAIKWDGGGNSKWIDINASSVARGWYEGACGTSKGTHYWYSSKLTATASVSVATTYRASCDESFFFGSEIDVVVPSGSFFSTGGAVVTEASGIIHVYGSVLRAFIDGQHSVYAASANSGEIHIHGTGIDVSSKTGANIAALAVSSGGMIHANASGYILQTTGTKTRILNNGGMIMAPYLWQEDMTPPDIISSHGSDQVVATNTADGHPHLMIYDTSCTSKWFDTVTRACN